MERDQLVNEETGKRYSKESNHELEYVEEECYVFNFGEYLDQVEDYITNNVWTDDDNNLITSASGHS